MAKAKKEKLTKAQKQARGRLAIYIILIILLFFAFIAGIFAILNSESSTALVELAGNFKKVEYAEGEQLKPVKDKDDDWVFVTNNEFKIIQLTDVHLGGGFLSTKKDRWAMNAVANMITVEKPDLVVVTGDAAFPVPFSSGSFNNYSGAQIFAEMMETLGVYWVFAYGNHDTEAYSYFDRADLDKFYSGVAAKKDSYCLYKSAKNISGYGNQVIKIKNTEGIVTQAITILDSHSYTDGDNFGILWKYDNLHEDQIKWYEKKMDKINADNAALGVAADHKVKNLAFFHIALREYREAWKELITADQNKNVTDGKYNNTENVIYKYGKMGEDLDPGKQNPMVTLFSSYDATYGIFCGIGDDQFFEVGQKNGLQGVFIGHDHLNNFSVEYKGVRLTYGMSIDYLAYAGIWKQKSQRGCTVITVRSDESFDCYNSCYYKKDANGKSVYNPDDEATEE